MRHGQGQGLTGGRVDMEDGRFGGFSVILLREAILKKKTVKKGDIVH